jgi:hypothetical protein
MGKGGYGGDSGMSVWQACGVVEDLMEVGHYLTHLLTRR